MNILIDGKTQEAGERGSEKYSQQKG